MVLNFEFHNHVHTRLRYLSALVLATDLRPDGHPPAYFGGLVDASKASLQQVLGFYNGNNAAAGLLQSTHAASHLAAVQVYGCMKSCYRDDPGCTASIRRLPKNDYSPETTFTRMNAILDVWGTLPVMPATGQAFTSGTLAAAAFAKLCGTLDKKMSEARVAEAHFLKELKRFNEQDEAWDRFVSAALTQGRSLYAEGTPERAVIGRVPVAPSTQPPEQAVFSLAQEQSEGAVRLAFDAEHATSFEVWHQGPGETEFAQVADVLRPGEYYSDVVPAGRHQYKVFGVNSRGRGPESQTVSFELPERNVA